MKKNTITESEKPNPKFYREGTRIYFSRETERSIYFCITVFLVFTGLYYWLFT